ncbi:prepilin-type N-terminal cleavage/methylation domain-containing protein [Thiomicrorhabdus sp.]|uniref:prepilin-type N-terminal cleavage/methylation domain-containing protein n=1 Tax=Thiomicrorhabdus sp. TaxID=2039724 RepID=UPI00356581F2
MVSRRVAQSGFTLIELMVVVVIMSVVVTVGMMSIGSSEQATLRSQERSVKSLLSFVRDQAALKQRLYLVAVDEKGLSAYSQQRGKWQKDEKIDSLAWSESLQVEWTIDNQQFARQQNLPREGWVFWPSGDVMAGSVLFSPRSNSSLRGKQAESSYSVHWNGLLQFDAEQENGNVK